MRKGITTITLLGLFMSWQLAAHVQANTQQNYHTVYQSMLDKLVSEYIPGAVLYVESEQGRFIGSAGFQDLAKKQPMATNIVIPNGSAGKKLTALLVAMLNQQDVLELDAPISRYLDKKLLAQIQYSEAMTLRQLLNHTSGIIEYNDVGDYAFFKAQYAKQKEVTTDEFPLSFALNQKAEFAPAERFSYSNTGYALVGVILEGVLKAHPASAIRNQILRPLGMTSSYSKGVETHQPELASGFFINDEDPDFPTPMNVWVDMKKIIGTTATSDAPLASNVIDMAKLLRAIVRSNEVVSENVRNQMIGEQHLVASSGPRFYRGSKFRYGLGVWVEEIAGNKFYHHGGTEFGYYTQNIYILEGDVSITAFVNCGVNSRCESAFQDFTFEIVDSFLHIR
ncbi:beta-lactamase family protein [Pseudoalteromonas sp. JBTF-M23]|uniref:Beta-lactamase family protein n=1 Tax=Pseudoalteromonas caenipelagi TaxID=2726988 RepID=A0A849V9A1_9GAMM|nr:serine hydrolase domain-containing protein [Pseudoalteromonas caenipelagi]NOU49806.1 beta-lactamase family protein [Pseudoalteromonas caenipelagi]